MSRGFTLIEVLIASGILVVAAGAVLRISQVAIRNEDQALERVRAYHLVQEGFEIVHQIRDSIRLDKTVNRWDAFLPTDDSSYAARWDSVSGRWVLEPAGTTVDEHELDGIKFIRSIVVSVPPTDLLPIKNEAGETVTTDWRDVARLVTVTVSWESQGQTMKVSGKTLLTDWQR